MIKRKIYLLLSLTVLSLCCVSCIQLCIETSRSQKYAAKHSEFKALNADDLKRLLIDDTSCYKFVVFYSPCCGPCKEHMQLTYPGIIKSYDSKTVKWYFILEDTGGIKHVPNLLKQYNLNVVPYYFSDKRKEFCTANENKWNNLINYIFPEGEKVNDAFDIPLNLIVDKHGRLLKSYKRYSKEMRVYPRELYDIKDVDIRETDFLQMDTLDLDWEPYICTGKDCKL